MANLYRDTQTAQALDISVRTAQRDWTRARAWLHGEPYVSPEHIQEIAVDILRHRLLLSFEAEAEGITSDDLIERLISLVAIP